MAFLRNLFSSRPKLPDSVHDPYDGDGATRREIERLKQGDWRGADALLSRFSYTYSRQDRNQLGPILRV